VKTFLLLGRFGDITTLLPALKHEADLTGRPTQLVVAKDFAPLLEGVSYVEPLIYDGPFENTWEAASWAARRSPGTLVNCAVYGRSLQVSHDMSSFNREIWRLSGCPLRFDDAPLLFDRRDAAREKALIDRVLLASGRRVVLFAGAGRSSPFAGAPALRDALKAALDAQDFDLVDISDVKAERPYDLLGLYGRAWGLVATDSFPLHLAQACPTLPVVALVCDGPTPWHRSAPRDNHVLRLLYSEAVGQVRRIADTMRHPQEPRLVFVTSFAPVKDTPTQTRMARAAASRGRECLPGEWTLLNFQPKTRSALQIGDRTPLPYIHDMVEAALQETTTPHDIVVLGNSDLGIIEGTTGRIREIVARFGCAYAHRWDFSSIQVAKQSPRHESDLKQAVWYPGSDLFAFTRAWWEQNKHLYPDMILGREAWDMVLRNLMKATTGGDNRCELQAAIWHERHASPWERSPHLAGNAHNTRLASAWLSRHGGNWNDWQGLQKYRGFA